MVIARGLRIAPRLAILFLLAGCQVESGTPTQRLVAETRTSDLKILIVGIDGATFRVLDPLLDSGELPVLAGLIERGAKGILKSMHPSRSPALWTTIVTGKVPSEHGVFHFRMPPIDGDRQDRVLASSRHRKSLALWNLMGPFGKSVGFLGWWATWPAEPVNGWLVSDRLTHSRWVDWTRDSQTERLTFPSELANELQGYVVDPMSPPMDEVDQLLELLPEERREFLAAERPIFAHWLSVFKFAYSSQRSYEEMALDLLGREQPDLIGLFLIANDPVSHTFWHFYKPAKYEGVDPADAERLGSLIPNFQRHNDRYLGQVLSLLDPATVVFVVSDHGFRASGKVPQSKPVQDFTERLAVDWRDEHEEGVVAVGQSGRHSLDGVLIASGGPIRRGVRTKAKLVDIAPTILALMGLPVPRDMRGRVLVEIIDSEHLAAYPIRTIDSYSSYFDLPVLAATTDEGEEKALEMLRSLGYIQ